MARGTWATLVWLGIVTLGVVAVSGLVLALFDVGLSGSEDSSYFEEFWQSLLRVLDTGTMAGDTGWGRRLLALFITIFGVLVAGTLIGVIAAGVEDRIERMRRGRSVIFESGHAVVLGASDRLPLLIRQLVLAGANAPDSAIVVMADRDPADMQDSVRRAVDDLRGSRIVYRSGDPTHRSDLKLVRLEEARTIIVLADESAGDPRAIRTVVAVRAELGSEDSVPVVVELGDEGTAERLVRVYGSGVHPIVPTQAVARIAAVALREPGAGQVAIALLDDQGSDIHIIEVPGLKDRKFIEALQAFPTARPIGIMGPGGETELNPPPDTRFGAGDRVILVSGSPDVSAQRWPSDSPAPISPGTVDLDLSLEQPEQHLLVWGWSELATSMISDWAEVAAPSSSVEVLGPANFDGGRNPLDGLGLTLEVTQSHDFSDLAARLARPPTIDTILLCAPQTENGEEGADSRTLLDLAGIRRLLRTLEGRQPRVIVELLDVDNIPLADMPNSDDFVVSDAIASQLVAQLAEQPERRNVFLKLYDPAFPSIYLVPAERLGVLGRKRATDVYEATYRFGLLAIGWRRPGIRGSELVFNPSESEEFDLTASDQIVVIG